MNHLKSAYLNLQETHSRAFKELKKNGLQRQGTMNPRDWCFNCWNFRCQCSGSTPGSMHTETPSDSSGEEAQTMNPSPVTHEQAKPCLRSSIAKRKVEAVLSLAGGSSQPHVADD